MLIRKHLVIIALRTGPAGLGLQCQRGGPHPSSTVGLAPHTSGTSAPVTPLAGPGTGPFCGPTEFLC